MLPPPSQSTVAVCNQITLLILYSISSRLVTFLKINDAPVQVSNIFFILLLVSSSSILAFRYPFFPKMSAIFTSYIVQIIYIAPLH